MNRNYQQYTKPNLNMNTNQYSNNQKSNFQHDTVHNVRMNYNITEQQGAKSKTNQEDFLWSRLNIWEKRQIIGMMTNAMTETFPR